MMIQWRKSSYSQGQGEGECVEVSTNTAAATMIRDSKDPNGPHLVLDRAELAAFLAHVRAERFDR